MQNTNASQLPDILVLSTQHFDILWRRPMARYRELEEQTFRRVLGILDRHPEYRFMVSQANVLRYFVEMHPEMAPALKERIRKGAIEITGGLETLHDTNVISGESMVRNAVYGRRWTEQSLGVRPEIASLGDSFGSSGQIPQILNKLGYRWLLPGRMPGHGIETSRTSEPYVWTGLDGSSIPGVMMFDYIPPGDDVRQRLIGAVERLLSVRDLPEPSALFLLGEEELPLRESVEAVCELVRDGRRVRFGTYLEHLQATDWRRAQPLTGEFNVEFSGCFTTRIRTKQWSRQAESALLTAEFLMAAETLLGLSAPPFASLYPAWLALFECQFHDAIGGCHIDSNYRYIRDAYEHIETLTEAAVSASVARLASAVTRPAGRELVACANPLPHRRKDVVTIPRSSAVQSDERTGGAPCQADGDTIRFLADVGPGGVAAFGFNTGEAEPAVTDSIAASGIRIGAYRVVDTPLGPRFVAAALERSLLCDGDIAARIVAREDTGDLWTERFSGARAAEAVGDSRLDCVEVGPVFAKLVYSGSLPASRVGWDGFESLNWRKAWYVYRELDRVDLLLDVEWHGKATEVSVAFAPAIDAASSKARYEIPFGSIVREPYPEGLHKYGKGNWPALSWCDCSDDRFGVTFVHGGTPGCLAKDGVMSFSVLRSAVSFDPGMFPCPPEEESFDNGCHSFTFSLVPHSASDREWLRRARECAAPLAATPWPAGDVHGLLREGILEIGPSNVALSTLKPADDGRGVILRVYEILGEMCEASIKVASGAVTAFETAMDESADLGPVVLESVPMAPFEIKTIRILPSARA